MDEKHPNNYKVLVVEDNIPTSQALIDKLSSEGFEPLSAKDGREGVALAEQHKPDLIMLDILMPKMNGLAVVSNVREQGAWGKKVPIILLTNLNQDQQEINDTIEKYKPIYFLIKSNWSISEVIDQARDILNTLKSS